MIPRSRTDVVAPGTSVGEIRELMAAAHTRYPVIDGRHVPVGVVHLIDVLGTDLPDEAPVSELMREPLVVPELMALPDAVGELQARSEKLACVIDEYGGFIGVITIEDLAEEILGDVTDEHDLPEPEEITHTREDEWLVDGDTPLDEVSRAIGHDLPEGDFETLSGLLLSHAGGLLAEGEVHELRLGAEPEDYLDDGEAPLRILRMHIESVERRVPALVRLELVEEPAADTADTVPGEDREEE